MNGRSPVTCHMTGLTFGYITSLRLSITLLNALESAVSLKVCSQHDIRLNSDWAGTRPLWLACAADPVQFGDSGIYTCFAFSQSLLRFSWLRLLADSTSFSIYLSSLIPASRAQDTLMAYSVPPSWVVATACLRKSVQVTVLIYKGYDETKQLPVRQLLGVPTRCVVYL